MYATNMEHLSILLILAFNCFNAKLIKLPQCNKYAGTFTDFFTGYKLKDMENSTTLILHISNMHMCLYACMEHIKCQSCSISEQQGLCLLHERTSLKNKANLIEAVGWMFVESDENKHTDGPVCQSKKPCLNKGKCIEQCEEPGYQCECPIGTYGKHCNDTEALLSQGKPAELSSIHGAYFAASKAFDGNMNQICHDQNDIIGSCAHSKNHKVNWLQVDLGKTADINRVKIYNRFSSYHASRLHNATIDIAKSSDMETDKQLCASFLRITSDDQIQNFDCDVPIEGRYVRLTQRNDKAKELNICEMQVYGYYKD